MQEYVLQGICVCESATIQHTHTQPLTRVGKSQGSIQSCRQIKYVSIIILLNEAITELHMKPKALLAWYQTVTQFCVMCYRYSWYIETLSCRKCFFSKFEGLAILVSWLTHRRQISIITCVFGNTFKIYFRSTLATYTQMLSYIIMYTHLPPNLHRPVLTVRMWVMTTREKN